MSNDLQRNIAEAFTNIIRNPQQLQGDELTTTRIWLRNAVRESLKEGVIERQQHNVQATDKNITPQTTHKWITPLYTDHPIPTGLRSNIENIQNIIENECPLYPKGMKIFAGIGSRETPPDTLKKMEIIAKSLSDQGWLLRSGGAEKADDAFERGIFGLNGHIDKNKAELMLGWNNIDIKREDGIPSRLKNTSQGYIVTELNDNIRDFFSKGHSIGWDKATGIPTLKNNKSGFLGAIRAMEDTPQFNQWNRQGLITPTAIGMLHLVEQFHSAPGRLKRGGLSLMARNGQQIYGPELNKRTDATIAYTVEGSGRGGTGQALRMSKSAGIPCIDIGHPTLAAKTPEEIVYLANNPQLMEQHAATTSTSPTTNKRQRDNAADLF